MADQTAQLQVPILAALAQATRLEILGRVAGAGAKGVAAGDIARSIRCPASTLSFHLKELSRTGILEARPRGRFIIYSLQRETLDALARFISGIAGVEPAPRARKPAVARSAPRRAVRDRAQLSMFGD
ncbi:MAG: ArsR/SmtB family transcription factor [Steroidobacteraceae bacterium]